jgi:ABC-2 type transport system ATP-binding protein
VRTDAALDIRHLLKTYGSVVAVDDLSLEVPRGAIYGLVGRNGAGKTTTLNLLIGLLRPDAGSAFVHGHDVSSDGWRARQRVSFVSEEAGIYPWLTGEEAARHTARLSMSWNEEAFRRCAVQFDLPLTRTVSRLSKGMRTQLLLALAVGRDPHVYLLDEPTSGLDPVARRHVFQLLAREVRERGRTVLLSSHVLSELSDACSHVGIIDKGRLKLSAELGALRSQWRKYQYSSTRPIVDALAESLSAAQVQKEGDNYTMLVAGDHERTLARLRALSVSRLHVSDANLDEIFLSVIAADASVADARLAGN